MCSTKLKLKSETSSLVNLILLTLTSHHMREVISIYIGQAGLQIGDKCQELFNLEHKIGNDGRLVEKTDGDAKNFNGEGESFQTFYSENSTEKFVPRSIMIDLDPSTIDEIKTGKFKDLYRDD